MCGIFGLYNFNNSTEYIKNLMSDSLEHRGPDAHCFWNDDVCMLGHRRLGIIDLSEKANQPMKSHCGKYIISYNGEIYNFKEIAEEIKSKRPDIAFRTKSDTEVVMEAFALWGADMVSRFNGMFAIAIYDTVEQKLYLFRDRIGVKPLYYYHHNNELAFSSELKALTIIPEIRKNLTINKEALRLYLLLGYVPAPYSIWDKIYKFPQGEFAVVTSSGIVFSKYWSLKDKIRPEAISDENQALEELEQLLLSSVKYRMLSDVPFGMFLSGGIDSSLVTALAQEHSSVPVNTFTIGFKESKYNESVYAKKIADYLKTNHHEFIVSENDAMELIPSLMDVYDEPFFDSSAVPTMVVSKLAKQYVTVALTGDGGDELFMSYGTYNWAKRLNNPVSKIFHKQIASLLRLGNDRLKRGSWLFDYDDEQNLKSHIFSQEQGLFSRKEINEILSPSYRGEFSIDENMSDLKRKLNNQEAQALFDLHYYLPDDLLVKADRASMKYSLETRVPLLDYRIVEFAMNLHYNLKKRAGETKYLLKKVLYKYVPEVYFNRPKRGFSIPLHLWMRQNLHSFVMETLQSEKLSSLLDTKATETDVFKKWHSGNDLYYNKIWQLVILGMWADKEF